MRGDLVPESADHVPERVAAEGIATQKDDVRRQHERADSDPELSSAIRTGKPERLPDVARENDQKHERHVEEVTMDVLNDERKAAFAQVALPWLADGAVRWVGPERLVIRAAIVIAGHAKQPRERKDQQRR